MPSWVQVATWLVKWLFYFNLTCPNYTTPTIDIQRPFGINFNTSPPPPPPPLYDDWKALDLNLSQLCDSYNRFKGHLVQTSTPPPPPGYHQ